MSDITPTALCQADECSETPDFVCEAWVMTPPTRGFLTAEVYLCSEHAAEFERRRELSVLLDPSNPDLLSVARWRDGENSSECS